MRVALLLLAVALLAPAAPAQSEWRDHPDGASLSLDVLGLRSRSSFGFSSVFGPSYGYSTSRLFSAQLLSARVPVSSRVTLTAELPFVYRDYDLSNEDAVYLERLAREVPAFATELGQTHSQVAVGNPMVGAEVAVSDAVRLDASVRLPSQRSTEGIGQLHSHRAADVVGRLIEIDRSEAYLTGMTSLTLGASGRHELPAGITLSGRVAPVLTVMDRDVLDASPVTEARPTVGLSVRMGAFARGHIGPVALGLGAAGLLNADRGWGRYYGRGVAGIGQIALDGLPVRPGLQYRAGVQGPPNVLSFSLDVPLR